MFSPKPVRLPAAAGRAGARRRVLTALLVAVGLLLPSGLSFADTPPVTTRTWTLQGVTFADGATLAGRFDLSSGGILHNVDISVTGGILAAHRYGSESRVNRPNSGPRAGIGYQISKPDLTRYLYLNFGDVSGAATGDVVPLVVGGTARSFECNNCGTVRFVTGGSIVAGPGPDTTAPALAPAVTPDPVLLNGTATASAGASDDRPGDTGVASSSCGAVDTSTVGLRTVRCTATDNAGNTAEGSAEYRVLYGFSGFGAPVDGGGVVNVVKAGQAVPLKWTLTDAAGAPVTTLSSDAVTVTVTLPHGCSGEASADEIEQYAAGGSGLQSLGGGAYQFNWATPKGYAGQCATLSLHLGDGSTLNTAMFAFK